MAQIKSVFLVLLCTATFSSGDDTAFLQNALKNLTETGGVLLLDPRRYTVSGTLAVPDRVTLQGQGQATVLYQPHSFTSTLITLGRQSCIRDLQMDQEHPEPDPNKAWTPYTDYDFQIRAQYSNGQIINLIMVRTYQGIAVNPAAGEDGTGRVKVTNVRMWSFLTGILIDHACDVTYLHQIHFSPVALPGVQVVQAWTMAHGTAILSYRNDNPMFSQIFAFAYKIGIHFTGPSTGGSCSGKSSKPQIVQFDCDACVQAGVLVDADGVAGLVISQYAFQGSGTEYATAHDGAAAIALSIPASGVTASVSQADWTLCGSNCVRIGGKGSVVAITGSLFRSWNVNGKASFPALEADGQDSHIVVSGGFYAAGTNGAGFSGGSVTVGSTVVHVPNLG